MRKSAVCASLALLSCGTENDQDTSQGNDAGAGGMGGEIKECSGPSFDAPACVIEPPDFVRAGYEPIQGLTVVGLAPADPADCSVLVPAGEDTRALLASMTTRAWALQNDSGDQWVVLANASFFPERALLPGDTVSLEYVSSYGDSGVIVVSSDDSSMLGILESASSTSLSNSLHFSRKADECKVEPCWTRSSVQISMDSASIILGTDEQGVIDDFTFLNDYYQALDPCQATADQGFFNIAMYRTPE